jgi:integrase
MTTSRRRFGEKVVRRKLADGTIREYRYPPGGKAKIARYAPDSLDALLAAWRRSPDFAGLAKATRATYGVYLRDLDAIGAVSIAALRRRDLLDIRDAIAAARGNGAATGWQRTASALLSWAVERGWMEHNPLARAKALPGGHLTAWTEEDAASALAGLDEPYRRVVVLGMHTGQRRGDLIAMTWGQYDGASIRLRQQKTRRHHSDAPAMVIPLSPEARAALDAWRAERQAAVILTSPQGRPWTAAHLTREMTKRLRALGLPEITVHGLRKLAATRLANAGCSSHEIAAITGQSLAMVELYTRSADQQRLAVSAVERLENARRKRDGK